MNATALRCMIFFLGLMTGSTLTSAVFIINSQRGTIEATQSIIDSQRSIIDAQSQRLKLRED